MAASVIGALRVELDLGTGGWTAGLSQAEAQAEKSIAKWTNVGARMSQMGMGLQQSVTAPLLQLAQAAVPAAQESAQAMGQVEAALKSMGPAAGFSSAQLGEMASGLMRLSTFDDDEILRKVTANMLTFGNVAGEQFTRAQQAAVDLATRMGTDLQSATVMVGKALNDPAKGLAALRRVGIQFTAQQQEQIKAMAAAGDTAGAQSIMLAELERQFGGSAKAMRDATPGADLKNAWDDFNEAVGGAIIQVLPAVTAALSTVLDVFNALPSGVQSSVVVLMGFAALLGPLLTILGPLTAAVGAFAASLSASAVAAGGWAPVLAPILPIVAAVAAAVGAAYLVWKNWDTIGPILKGVWDALVATLGPPLMNLVAAVKEALLALWNSAFVQGIATVLGKVAEFHRAVLEAFGSAIPGVLKALGALFSGVVNMIADALRFVVAILTGDWQGAWQAAGSFVGHFAEMVEGVFGGLVQAVTGFVSSMVRSVQEWLGDRLLGIFNRVKGGIDAVKGWFYGMYDAVVGHSFVPDMVDGIAQHFARLDSVMVDKAKGATAKTSEAFKKLADEVRPLLERLFPEATSLANYTRELKLLDDAMKAGVITADQLYAARMRLAIARDAEVAAERERNMLPIAALEDGSKPLVDPDKVAGDLERLTSQMDRSLFDPLKDKTAETIERFAGMSREVLGSLRGMVQAFKGGDILGGIVGFFDLVTKVIGAVRGLSPGASVTPAPYGGGRALGGPVVAGKSYRVGERGPEWFTPASGGMISPDSAGGGNVYHISGNLLTPEFWAQIQSMSDDAATRGALGGAQLAGDQAQRRARYSLGGRR